jgi:hypothetical protein
MNFHLMNDFQGTHRFPKEGGPLVQDTITLSVTTGMVTMPNTGEDCCNYLSWRLPPIFFFEVRHLCDDVESELRRPNIH